jgi:hypothetical protein
VDSGWYLTCRYANSHEPENYYEEPLNAAMGPWP